MLGERQTVPEFPRGLPIAAVPWDATAMARQLLAHAPHQKAALVLGRWLERDLTRVGELNLPQSGPAAFASLLAGLNIRHAIDPAEIARIPASGPLVVVANHPFGLVEGPLMWSVLSRVRSDIKFLANSLLMAVPQLHGHTIPVDPFEGPDAVRRNWKPVREAVAWIREGHALVVFPAGEVASLQWPRLQIADPAWNDRVARIIRLARARVLPVFFHGTNSPAFHLAGLIHPRLRTLLLLHELLNKEGRTIRVSIGSPIQRNRLEQVGGASEVTAYLRARTMLLETRRRPAPAKPKRIPRGPAPLAAAVDEAALRAEVEGLSGPLVAAGDLCVYLASAGQIPLALLEIGRLREVTFRAVGEGTGHTADLDRFDRHYRHLFLWNHQRGEIAGAYRFAATDEPAASGALRRLYTHSLFRLTPGFLTAISPALELGRSFVRGEYQRSYQPLLLLWRAIGQIVAAQPRYRFLFGPVSISHDYSPPSRALMVSFLRSRCSDPRLARHIRPRHKYHLRTLRDLDWRNFTGVLAGIEEVSELVAEIEPDQKAVPILLRQYLNLGGQVLDFSVDGGFSNVLDGLVVVDLTKTNARLLDRYLGKAGAANFRAYHKLDRGPASAGESGTPISLPNQLPGVE